MKIIPFVRVRAALGAALLLAAAPAWSQTGSLDTWVDTCGLQERDISRVLRNEALVVHEGVITANDDGTYTLLQQSYTHTGIQGPQPICTDSRWYGQPQVNGDNFRSAVQVGPDLILTAWHNPVASVPPVVVVFGLQYRMVGDTCAPPDFTRIPAADVYFPIAVVADGYQSTPQQDFLLLRLDRSRSGSLPRVRRSGRPRAGDALTHIGHPDRLATKVDLAGTLVGNLGSPPSVFPQVVNLHAIIGSSGSMVYNRSERFVETVTRSPMGASFAFDPANNCRRLTHSDQPGLPNVSVAHFARNIPPFELLVSPLDTVVHVGPVGGPFTNPVTTRTVRVDGTSPAPVGYRVETAVVGDPGPQLLVSTEVTPVGTLAPGGSFSVFETIDAATAPCGVYERTYKVIDTTHGFTDVVRHRFEIGLNHCSLASAGRSGRE